MAGDERHAATAPPGPLNARNTPETISNAMQPAEMTATETDRRAPWQRELAAAIRDPARLRRRLGLPTEADADRDFGFPVRVTESYLSRMRHGDPDDPLLRQVLPDHHEGEAVAGYSDDPVGDLAALHDGGVLHKYHGRALLVATGACAIHCRYCFRREFPYAQAHAATAGWAKGIDYIRRHADIHEVILSGGDPLVLPDRLLARLAGALRGIGHVRRLRIHSRLPVVLPARIDDALLDWFARSTPTPVMVIHANHPAEIDADVAAAVGRLRAAGVAVFNQAVLLRGVNDDPATVATLCEKVFDIGALPYYLHLLDPVTGSAHFAVPRHEAEVIMRAVAARLPGYLVPRLVREIPGAASKTWVPWDDPPKGTVG